MTTSRPRLTAAAGALLFALALSGCASHALKQARVADELRQYDVAVAQYMKVLRDDPSNAEAQFGLSRAKLRAADAHLYRGRRLASQGHYEDALLDLQLALELNPGNGDVDRELRGVRKAMREALAAPPEGQTALQTLLDSSRNFDPAGPQLPDVKLPDISIGRTASARDAFVMLSQLTKLSVTFDAAFRDGPAQVGVLSAPTLRQALDAIARSSNTFYRVTGENEILVINDTPAKQREYQEEVTKTFYLHNADMKETMDAFRIAGDVRNVAPITALNAVQVKDTAERVKMLGGMLAAFDKAPPEIAVDVEVLEVNRTDLQEYGLQIATPGASGIVGTIEADREFSLSDLRSLSGSDFVTSAIPALFYRLLKTSGNTRTLANPRLRIMDGVAAVARFGEDVPVPKIVIQPITQGGLNIQPQTSFDYRTIGVNIAITPRTHPNDDVTLTLNIELSSLAGTGFDGLPTFGSRTVQTKIRLRDGETNILAGLIRDDLRTERQSIPGLGKIPILGTMLFAKNHREASQTDVVIMLTPHIVRPLTITADDLRPVRIPRDGGTSLLEGAPTVPVPPIIREPDQRPIVRDPDAPSTPGPTAPPSAVSTPSLPVAPGTPSGVPVPTSTPRVIKK
jgi:general secretion pathway protein D